MNYDWWNEFLAQTARIGQTFVPAIIGFAAVIKNIASIADAQQLPIVLVPAVAAHLVVSVFLTGGVLDRLARDRRVGTYGFFSACGTCFFRLLRLSLIAAVVYLTLFASLRPWLLDTVFAALVHDATVERTAIIYRALLYLLFGLLVLLVNVVFDYAKIRMVVEDRRSALGALNSAARFIARNSAAAFGLYFLNLLIFVVALAVYAIVAPGAAGGLTAWIGFFIGQLYITARIVVRLLFMGSQIALFQGRLAHAGYTAAPVATWPDSPAADAIIPS
jgi:hypothetical protein